jgi:MoxR-like ATPase
MDRFLMRLSMGYPDRAAEKAMIRNDTGSLPAHEADRSLTPETLVAARREVRSVHVDEALLDYLLQIVEATRVHPDLALGASPRASLALSRAAQAAAYLDGRDFVTPDDIKRLISPVLAHRLVLRDPALDPISHRDQVRALLVELLDRVPVPL